MRLVWRYRAALRAYPAGYRRAREPELAATLAEGDDERGRPSTREAAALAYSGLAMRARLAGSPGGLLVASAAFLLLSVTGGFDWAERVFLFRGEAAAMGSDGPGWWSALALAVGALIMLAAVPFGAVDDPRRRRLAVLLAAPLTFVVFCAPGRIFYAGLPDAATVGEYLRWAPEAFAANWTLTVPGCIAAVVATSVALRALARMRPPARQLALGAGLALPAAVVVIQAWHRPDLPAEYARSAFADLGAATFIAAAGLALAVAAMWRSRPGATTA